jgi:hypothetical protein
LPFAFPFEVIPLTTSREGEKMEFRQLLKAVREAGFRIERTRNGHWKVFAKDPEKRFALLSGNPRAMKKMLADLRRIGFRRSDGGRE